MLNKKQRELFKEYFPHFFAMSVGIPALGFLFSFRKFPMPFIFYIWLGFSVLTALIWFICFYYSHYYEK